MIDNLVIGGGLAGAAVAIRLAQAGRQVVLLEREAGAHDKVCGEFLSLEATAYLRRLGVVPQSLGAAAIDAVDVCRGTVRSRAKLPFQALSLSRRVLDEALLARAGQAGVEVRRGVRATRIDRSAQGWRVATREGPDLQGAELFLATGKHDVRGLNRPPGLQADLIGFKMHWRLAPVQLAELGSRVELHLFGGGYAGLERVEGDVVNLCLVVRKRLYDELDGWAGLLARMGQDCPLLTARLAGAETCFARPLAVAAIPYGYVRRRGDGVWRLGDQAAVIPSFAGEGMAIALHSGFMAADARLQGEGCDAYQRQLARHVALRVRGATAVSQALVRPRTQQALALAARVRPGLVAALARATRLPAAAHASGVSWG